MSSSRIYLLFALLVVGLPAPAGAQYFGQNKVRYEQFDFKVLKTNHFDVHYYDEETAAARDVARMAERWYMRLSKVLNHELTLRQPIVLYASHPAFRSTTVIPEEIGESTRGVTESQRRRLVIPVGGSMAETDHVLGHELVHAFQFDMTGGDDGSSALALPLWFVEGMAEYLSIGPWDPFTAMWMRDAVRREDIPKIAKLDSSRYFPYRYGHALWAYVGGRYGDEVVGRLFRVAATSGVNEAIKGVLNVSADALSSDWRKSLEDRNGPVLRTMRETQNRGRTLIEARKSSGELNVSPTLSPDGSRVIFFSEQDTFSIDLFLADARTGAILGKITQASVDPHLDSLQFIDSAGAWSPDSQRFAFGSIRDGRPEVSIYDVGKRRIERRIPLPGIGEVFHLSWSPDGRSMAMSALSGGRTDLFILDLSDGATRRLTGDSFAELQPEWSPDGQKIAFVTDRFANDPSSLYFGNYRLGIIDVASGDIQPVFTFEVGKQINPQWADNGHSVLFISDRDGVSNIYCVSIESGSIRQLTHVASGVSGITGLSPAFSASSNGGRLVYSVFDGGNYSIETMELGDTTAFRGDALSQALDEKAVGTLPPRGFSSGQIASLLADPRNGLETLEDATTEQYHPRLSLDYIAPVEIGVGISHFGTSIGGGTTLAWSDLLGYHNVAATIQSSMTSEGGRFLNELAVLAGYMNQRSRWDWGFQGGQVPYTTGAFTRTVAPLQGLVIDSSLQVWQIDRELRGVVAYPFNRAQRLEFSAGYQNISFDSEARTETYDVVTGLLLASETQRLTSPPSLHLGNAGAALVYDTSIFAGTSPAAGQRYRMEFGVTTGSLKFGTFLADYRRYRRIARSFILAGRAIHVGRYGGDSEDGRLQNLFIGQQSLVRGYSPESFSPEECGGGGTLTCPSFDRMVGSRIAVFNGEFRIPLFGALGIVRSPGAPPVETALFYDAGFAWTRSESPGFVGGPRSAATSHGASVRINLLGFAIAQIDYVHPNNRPDTRWRWEFGLVQGF